MKFEEILPHLRDGKMARYPNYFYNENGYWIAGYVSIIDSKKTLTLIRVNEQKKALKGIYDWGIANWALLSDNWEVIDDTV